MELTLIEDLFEEIKYLKKKAELADHMLRFYDKETMTFIIPNKWEKLNIVEIDKLRQIPKSPRHLLNKRISELLPYSENGDYVNWDKVSETAAD